MPQERKRRIVISESGNWEGGGGGAAGGERIKLGKDLRMFGDDVGFIFLFCIFET